MAQVALAWVLGKPYVTSILLGASRVSQLDDNLGAENVALSAEEVAELDRETAPAEVHPNWFQKKVADAQVRDALQGNLNAKKG